MTHPETARLAYRISWSDGPRDVEGFAVNSPTGVRYCVRPNNHLRWIADDFDTGYAYTGRAGEHLTMESLIEVMETLLPSWIEDGSVSAAWKRAKHELSHNDKYMGALHP